MSKVESSGDQKHRAATSMRDGQVSGFPGIESGWQHKRDMCARGSGKVF
jgi:hypothetical protein